MRLLDGRFPHCSMFPAGLNGLLVHVLEEHLDEWIARVMVHYRWHYADSARFAAGIIGNNNPAAAERILNWGPRACRATGTATPVQQQAAEAEYERLLAAAESQLQQTAFLLGDRPTALDCIVLGGLRAHTNMDPDPKQVTARYPTVIDWCERRADSWDGGGELAPFDAPTAFAQHVLSEMADTYGRFVLGNAAALQAEAKAFHVQTYGEEVSYLTRPYPEQSRHMVIAHAQGIGDHAEVSRFLNDWGLMPVFGD